MDKNIKQQSRNIKSLLALKGVRPIDIAREMGVFRSQVSSTINVNEKTNSFYSKNKKIRFHICTLLGKGFKELWLEEPPLY